MAGITNVTAVTMDNVTNLMNTSDLPSFFIKMNHTIFGGVFWFIMMCITFVILFVASNKVRDQPLNNAFYSCAAMALLSLVLRAIYIIRDGVVQGFLTDSQMWIFPLGTLILAGVIWATK